MASTTSALLNQGAGAGVLMIGTHVPINYNGFLHVLWKKTNTHQAIAEAHKMCPRLFGKSPMTSWLTLGWQWVFLKQAEEQMRKLAAASSTIEIDTLTVEPTLSTLPLTEPMREHVRMVLEAVERGDIIHQLDFYSIPAARVDRAYYIAGTTEPGMGHRGYYPFEDSFRLSTEPVNTHTELMQLVRAKGMVLRVHMVANVRQTYWVEGRNGEKVFGSRDFVDCRTLSGKTLASHSFAFECALEAEGAPEISDDPLPPGIPRMKPVSTEANPWKIADANGGIIDDAHFCLARIAELASKLWGGLSGLCAYDPRAGRQDESAGDFNCFTPAMEAHIRATIAEAKIGNIRHKFEIHKFAGSRVDKQFWIAGTKETDPQMDLYRFYGNRYCTEKRHIYRDAIQLARGAGLVARMHIVVNLRQTYWVEDHHGDPLVGYPNGEDPSSGNSGPVAEHIVIMEAGMEYEPDPTHPLDDNFVPITESGRIWRLADVNEVVPVKPVVEGVNMHLYW
ncbi:hypothetical protein FOL47_002527 [Perkinsus chesapeaki]|uniref:Uncharacterized protein n=1 Tax=Perkinsus chesapeaki TaxID=330153 RepID=A0A7J6N076_PERCH|nr:hypothetical protein FOL47_002527 [Perkinsus chesapeaki]